MVSRLVRENLTRRARRFNLILDDVSITHVAFSPEFTHAVEAKQVAQQIAQRAAFLVDQAIQEKQSIIVRAQGEARSAELIGEAVRTNKGFLQLRRLEAAREIATTLAQSGNKVMLDARSLLLNGMSIEAERFQTLIGCSRRGRRAEQHRDYQEVIGRSLAVRITAFKGLYADMFFTIPLSVVRIFSNGAVTPATLKLEPLQRFTRMPAGNTARNYSSPLRN